MWNSSTVAPGKKSSLYLPAGQSGPVSSAARRRRGGEHNVKREGKHNRRRDVSLTGADLQPPSSLQAGTQNRSPNHGSPALLKQQTCRSPFSAVSNSLSFFFLYGRSGRRTPEKTKKNANGRKDGDDELRKGQRRNSLDEGDVLRAVVCDYVGPRGVCRNAEAGHTAAVASKTSPFFFFFFPFF